MLLRKALGQTTVDLMSYWIHFVINHGLPVRVLFSHSFFTEWSDLMVNSLVPSGRGGFLTEEIYFHVCVASWTAPFLELPTIIYGPYRPLFFHKL